MELQTNIMSTAKNHSKRVLIDKANTSMVISIAIAGFLVMFAIVAGRALLSQRSYQARVIGEKEKAVTQLTENIAAVEKLQISYKEFVGTPDNVIGGNPNGTGDKDGNNAKIVLDALPSKYDFPAFITSIEKLLKTKNFPLTNVGGNDDEVNQANTSSKDPVEIPFQLESEVSTYADANGLLVTLEQSIRPLKINKLTITGGGDQAIGIQIDGKSYFKAARGLTIEKKVVQ